MEQPIAAREAPDKLRGLLGDDDLFDVIYKVEQAHSKDADVRVFIKTALAKFILEQDMAFEPYEPEALKILTAACLHYLPPEFLNDTGRAG